MKDWKSIQKSQWIESYNSIYPDITTIEVVQHSVYQLKTCHISLSTSLFNLKSCAHNYIYLLLLLLSHSFFHDLCLTWGSQLHLIPISDSIHSPFFLHLHIQLYNLHLSEISPLILKLVDLQISDLSLLILNTPTSTSSYFTDSNLHLLQAWFFYIHHWWTHMLTSALVHFAFSLIVPPSSAFTVLL